MYGFIFYYLLPLIIIFIKEKNIWFNIYNKKIKIHNIYYKKIKIPIIKKFLNFGGAMALPCHHYPPPLPWILLVN